MASPPASREDPWTVGRGWIGGLNLGLSALHALAGLLVYGILQGGNLGIAALALLFWLGLLALGTLAFAVLGAAVLAGVHRARDAVFWANVLVAVLGFPLASIPHGLVAWLTRKRVAPDAAPALRATDPGAPASPQRGGAGDDAANTPFGLAVLVLALAVTAAGSLAQAGWLLFSTGPREDLTAAAGAGAIAGVLAASTAWGLARRRRWGWIGAQCLAGLLLLAGLIQPLTLLAGGGTLWYLRRADVAARFAGDRRPPPA